MRFAFRLGVSLVASALLGGALMVPALPANAVTEAYELLIVPEDPLMEPADEYVFTLRISNTGEEELPAGVAQFRLFTEPVTDLAGLTDLTDSEGENEDPSPESSTEITRIDTPQLGSGEVFDVSFTVPGDELPLTDTSTPGVYLTEGRWSETGFFFGTPALTGDLGSPLLWMADDFTASLQLATILPVVYPDAERPAITPAEVNSQITEGRTIQNLLTIAETYGAVAAIDPKIVAYVRSLGGTSSVTARGLVDRITNGSIDTFALQYADADPILQTRLLDEGVLQPTGTSFLTRFYTQPEATEPEDTDPEDTEPDHPELEPEPETTEPEPESEFPGDEPADPEEDDSEEASPNTPALSELLTWDTDREGYAWPTPQTVTAASIRALSEQGFTTIVLSGGSATGSGVSTLQGTTLLNSHESLELAARDLVVAGDELTATLAEARFAALTAVMGSDADAEISSQALLAFDREVASMQGSVTPVFELLESFPWVQRIGIDDLAEGSVTLSPSDTSDTAANEFVPAIDSEPSVVEHARVLEHPDELIDFQRDRLMSLLSVREPLDDTETAIDLLTEEVGAYLDRDAQLSDGISIVDTEHTRLVGSSSRIPIQLRNTLPFNAAVAGNLQTGTAALIVDEPSIEPTVIPAETTVNHLVSVQSRVSNGSATLLVSLDDTHEGETITSHVFNITMSSDIENYVLAGLGAVALTLFGLGAWRSVKRNRGAQRSADE